MINKAISYFQGDPKGHEGYNALISRLNDPDVDVSSIHLPSTIIPNMK